MRSRLLAIAIAGLVLTALSSVAHAQLGNGWTRYSPTKHIHLDDASGLKTFAWTASKSVCSPACADYRYDSATDTEIFRVLDNRSNRSEIRLQNEYSSGRRQFQGYVTFDAPLNDESLFQIFGSTSGATQLMVRGYAKSGGSIRGGGKTLATGVYGVERRINVIHEQGGKIRIYVNGSLKNELTDNEAVTNYHKYGCYGTLRTGAATVRWRAARSFKDGRPPASIATDEVDPGVEDASQVDPDEARAEDELAADEEPAEDAIDDEAALDDDSLSAEGCNAGGSAPGPVAVGLLGLVWVPRRKPAR